MGLFVATAIAFRLARRAAGFWTMDDAGITFAAAFELADHGTLAPYPEGTPVETYSNPAVFFATAALRWLGLYNPVTTHLHLETLLFASMPVLVWSALRAWTGERAAIAGAVAFVAVELVTPATWLWYGSGLENVWVSAGFAWLLWLCARTARGLAPNPAWGIVPFVVAITRPEAPVYVAAFYAALLVCARPRDTRWWLHVRRVALLALVTGALYAAFLVWRRTGYGAWWPNTYYAKLGADPPLAYHFKTYVVGEIFPYAGSFVFASTVIALLATRRLVACALLVLLVASLALPITAGEDWMGEHRFATPFLAVAHLTFGAFVALCATLVVRRSRLRWPAVALALGVTVLALASFDKLAIRDRIWLNDVTVGQVAHAHGGARWEHQMRVGLPFPVVMLPDAGGSLLVGGMQLVDNGYLADFQMTRIGKYYGDPVMLAQINQYQHAERRPDLVSPQDSGALDPSYLGRDYLPGDSHLYARRDLVELSTLDARARLLVDDGNLRLYLSPATVPVAAPGGLVRCELLVAWSFSVPDDDLVVRITAPHGDEDAIRLRPYNPHRLVGIERRGLLVGAPQRAGSYPVTLELWSGERLLHRADAFTLEVTTDGATLARTAAALVEHASPHEAARRIAWLREQQLERAGMQRFHKIMRALHREKQTSPVAGLNILRLRWIARLAAFEPRTRAIRDAEQRAITGVLATCPASAPPTRVLCLGRAVDELRRLGYLGVADTIAAELDAAEAALASHAPPARYQLLVGLTLARPGGIALQRQLVALRRELARAGALPSLTVRAR